MSNSKLYVGNLSFKTTEDELRSTFGQFKATRATLESSGQPVARLIRDGVPREKLFPLRQEAVPRRKVAELVRSDNGHHD